MKRHPRAFIPALGLVLALLLPVHGDTQGASPAPRSADSTKVRIEELKQQLQTVLRARLAAFEMALQETADAEMRERWEATTEQIDKLLVQLAESEKRLSAPARPASVERRRTREGGWFAFLRRRRTTPRAEVRTAAVAPADTGSVVTNVRAERDFHRILKTLARRIEGDRRDLERAESRNHKLQARTEAFAQAVQQLAARIRELEEQTPTLRAEELSHARRAGVAFSGEERTQAIDAMLRTRKQLRRHEDEVVKHRKERAKAVHKSLRMREKATKKQRVVHALEEKVAATFEELEAAIQAHPSMTVPEYVQRLLDSRQGRLLADVDNP